MRGDRLSVVVPDDFVDGDHSFPIVSDRSSTDGVTVTLEGGKTRLRVAGVDVVFEDFGYFPRDPDEYDVVDYRGDLGDAKITFAPADGREHFPDDLVDQIHPVTDTTVADLIDGLRTGSIEPLPKE